MICSQPQGAGVPMPLSARRSFAKLSICALALALLATTYAASPAVAQENAGYGTTVNMVGSWSSMSFATGHVFGYQQDRTLQRYSIRYGRRLWAGHGMLLRYSIEAVPAMVLGEPLYSMQDGHAAPGSPMYHVYGGGLSPVGIQMNFLTKHRVQPFLANDGGFVYSTRRILSPGATDFNFTEHVSLGVEVFATPHYALDTGYMLHHISNANLGNNNPGLDTHMIFFGVSVYP